MADKATNQTVAVQRFWDAFKGCLEENRLRPDRSTFYVKWAKAFVDFAPGKNCGIVRPKIYVRFLKTFATVQESRSGRFNKRSVF
ncbi:MAG: hypothetical protein AB7Y74_10675 [Syntrophorhabdus sp.]